MPSGSFSGFPRESDAVDLFSDSMGVVSTSRNPVLSAATKHVEIADFFVREMVARGIVTVAYVSTSDMVADVLTKPLARIKFSRFISIILGTGTSGPRTGTPFRAMLVDLHPRHPTLSFLSTPMTEQAFRVAKGTKGLGKVDDLSRKHYLESLWSTPRTEQMLRKPWGNRVLPRQDRVDDLRRKYYLVSWSGTPLKEQRARHNTVTYIF